MRSAAKTPTEYLDALEPERKAAVGKLHRTLTKNLPKGFAPTMAYGMITYVVPHSLYPAGYHGDPKQALPFISLASQKNYVSLHHMGLYDGPLLDWFTAEWKKHTDAKLDMGKCCVRFKKLDAIPYELIGKLAKKVTPAQWVATYEKTLER